MKEERIFTENPEEDLWRELLQFSYKANIERYFSEHSITPDANVVDCIIGSVLQAYEYYKASVNVNLQISPLLMYYGTTNLLYGMSSLMDGKIHEIHRHGMKPNASTINNGYIADATVNFEDPIHGGIHVFCRNLGYTEDLTKSGPWKLKDFLSSIAEISYDFKKCYSVAMANTIMLDVFNTPNGKIERVYFNSSNRANIEEALSRVQDFNKSYLPAQIGKDRIGEEYFILRHKMVSKDLSASSFSGQPYLQAAIEKNGRFYTLPTLMNYYVALFIMGSLCRYHPEIWSPFVMNDTTGERLLIERLLYHAKRIIPNLVLDSLYGYENTFVTEKYSIIDTVKLVGEHEVQELVTKTSHTEKVC